MHGMPQGMKQHHNGNPTHKFKRKPIYGHVKVGMNDNNFNGIEKIDEEPESLV